MRALIPLCLSLLLVPFAALSDPLRVQVDSGPVGAFVQAIAGEAAEVVFPAPPQTDPQFWRPSIAELSAVQSADLIVLNGAGFASWVERVSLPRARVVEASRGLEDRFIVTESVSHSHGDGAPHTHEGVGPYLWLDFALAAEQARTVAAGLARKLGEDAVAPGLRALEAELAALDARARALGAAAPGARLIASHPRYQYFARAYGFDIAALEWDADAAPSPERLAELAALRAAHPAEIVLWEGPPSDAMRAALEAQGLVVIPFDHGARMRPDEDFPSLMARGLDALEAALAR